jgi:hypothetical protein
MEYDYYFDIGGFEKRLNELIRDYMPAQIYKNDVHITDDGREIIEFFSTDDNMEPFGRLEICVRDIPFFNEHKERKTYARYRFDLYQGADSEPERVEVERTYSNRELSKNKEVSDETIEALIEGIQDKLSENIHINKNQQKLFK